MNSIKIIELICDHHGVPPAMVRSKARRKIYSHPRAEAIFCIRETQSMLSFDDIGKLFSMTGPGAQGVYDSVIERKATFEHRINEHLKKIMSNDVPKLN